MRRAVESPRIRRFRADDVVLDNPKAWRRPSWYQRHVSGVGLDVVGARAGSFPRASLESLWTKPLQYAARGPEDAPV